MPCSSTQVSRSINNLQDCRSVGASALGPLEKMQGGHCFINLETGKKFNVINGLSYLSHKLL